MNSLRKYCFAFCVFVVASSSGISASGQSQRDHPLANIPAQQRSQFLNRLQAFIKFQKERKWNEAYDLSIEHLEKPGLTREEFIKSHQEVNVVPRVSNLLEFSPSAATLINQWNNVKEWLIEGCATYRRKGKIIHLKAGLNSALSDGQWYFSYLSTVTREVDGPEQHCALPPERKMASEQIKCVIRATSHISGLAW